MSGFHLFVYESVSMQWNVLWTNSKGLFSTLPPGVSEPHCVSCTWMCPRKIKALMWILLMLNNVKQQLSVPRPPRRRDVTGAAVPLWSAPGAPLSRERFPPTHHHHPDVFTFTGEEEEKRKPTDPLWLDLCSDLKTKIRGDKMWRRAERRKLLICEGAIWKQHHVSTQMKARKL